jgi:hypothetical protein
MSRADLDERMWRPVSCLGGASHLSWNTLQLFQQPSLNIRDSSSCLVVAELGRVSIVEP